MDLIDFILNLAGLLLWLNWRSVRLDPFLQAAPATLGGTVRRAEPARLKRWHFLGALAVLLFVRALFYRAVGPEVNWVPTLNLSVVAPAFRGHDFLPVLLFSALSFLRLLLVFYFWLLAVAWINRRAGGIDPIDKLILAQLGRIGRWPCAVQVVLPLVTAAALWIVLHPALVSAGVLSRAQSNAHLFGQGLLVGAAFYLSLKLLLPAFLLLHLITSYVYVGRNPVWDFISVTARNLLAPLNRLPLRAGKVDLAPVAGLVLIGLLFWNIPWISVPWLTRWLLNRNGLVVWPN